MTDRQTIFDESEQATLGDLLRAEIKLVDAKRASVKDPLLAEAHGKKSAFLHGLLFKIGLIDEPKPTKGERRYSLEELEILNGGNPYENHFGGLEPDDSYDSWKFLMLIKDNADKAEEILHKVHVEELKKRMEELYAAQKMPDVPQQ